MRLRFYFDPETGATHIAKHGVSEREVEEFSKTPRRTARAATALELQQGALYLVGS
jgi:hypothetical protein